MYYLLEDNRIIDESKALHNVDKIIIEEKENKKYLYLVGWLGKHFCGKIKNQSENVYDLIDWGKDLVRIDWSDWESFIIDCNFKKNNFNDGYYSLDWITSIYKPNSKGDYIKVWEKKDE